MKEKEVTIERRGKNLSGFSMQKVYIEKNLCSARASGGRRGHKPTEKLQRKKEKEKD